MTSLGYLFAKVFATLGIYPLEKYRTNAAFETHLMRDAERVIGQLAWPDLENIEGITHEYWKLRKLDKKQSELNTKVDKLIDILNQSQDARAQAVEEAQEATQEKTTERDKTASQLEQLNLERDNILREAQAIKREHTGLKTKLEVLLEESSKDSEESEDFVKTTRQQLKEKRIRFETMREKRSNIEHQIEERQKTFASLNSEIKKENDSIRIQAEEQFGTIGKTNKELTSLRSEIGLIDDAKNELFAIVGQFIIDNIQDPTIKQATRKRRGLLTLSEEVRKSCARHHKLIPR